MKKIVIELEDDLHKKVKMQALSTDKTMKDYVRFILEKDLQKKEQTH